MKKLIVAVALVASAACANAAAVVWNSGNVKDHTGTLIAKGSTVYTAVCSFYTYDGDVYTDVSDTFGGILSVNTAGKNGLYTGTTGSTMASGTYYAKLVITGTDGWSIESDMAEFAYNSDAISNTQLAFQTGAGFAQPTAKLVNSGTNFGWAESVPEPTSGLLLLLGMAGLALRRRRA